MKIARHLLLSLPLALVACGEADTIAGGSARAVTIEPASFCAGLPAGLDGQPARRFDEGAAVIYLAPAYARPGEPLYVVLVAPQGSGTQWVKARVTSDGWASSSDKSLAQLCLTSGQNPAAVWALALGAFSDGARVELALQQSTSYAGVRWFNNGGANYRLDVRSPAPLQWVGDTHLRVGGAHVPPSLAPAGQPLGVYSQTYPMGAASSVELFWAVGDYSQVRSTAMKLDADAVGAHGSNSQWAATIPAVDVKAGAVIHYWIRAADHGGKVLWDSAAGANHHVTPGAFPVVWAGGLGSYRPTSGDYVEGSLFNKDGSTSTGCNNGGASMSSYVVRAVRLYVPGLTDRSFGSDAERQAAAAIVRAEVHTSANTSGQGWTSRPAFFVKQLGNDFLYTFLAFNDLCAGGGPNWGARLSDGDYHFKLRFSTDGGQTWFWRGSANGPAGGADLQLGFGGPCSYFGGGCPAATAPDGTMLRATGEGGVLDTEAGSLFSPLGALVLQDGKPVAGRKVAWTSASGQGWFFPPVSTSDGGGLAQTQWVPGPATPTDETVTATLQQSGATGASISTSYRATIKAVPRTANAVHLWYDFAPASAFQIEVVPQSDPPHTYYATMMWEGGYAGLQRQGDLFDRQVHFSVWDVAGVNAVIVDKSVSTCDPFGNEGTGIMCRFSYPWQVGKTYRFEVQAAKQTSTTDLTVLFTDLAAGKTIKAATLRYGKALDLRSSAAFVEDFGPAWPSCLDAPLRALELRNARAHVGGTWQKINSATFTYARPPSECATFDVSVGTDSFTLTTGGLKVRDPQAPAKLSLP